MVGMPRVALPGKLVRGLAIAGGLLTLLAAAGTDAVAAPAPSSLVNTIETWKWSPPSPDPSGVTYDSASNRLLVVDGEVEEMSIYRNANYYESTLSGQLLRTWHTKAFTNEPVGVAFDSAGRVLISDDDKRRVFIITLGLGGQFDQNDPVSSFSTTTFGSNDPEGIAYDAIGNRLFVADGGGSEIYVVTAADGVFGNGNDQVRHFDTGALGVSDPETVEWSAESGTLYTIGAKGDKIVEVTTSGARVSEVDTSYVPLDKPAGLAYAPRSTDATKQSFYITDRKVDNDCCPSENDGTIYEVTAGSAGSPPPPPPPPPPGPPVLDVRVAVGSNDAEESASGSVSLTSSDLELVTESSVQKVGMRFAGLNIPIGATITNAYVQFVADESQAGPTTLTVGAQAADNAAAFASGSSNISSRPRTSASVPWSPPAWSTGQAGAGQRTPDLKAVVQEVVGRPGWQPGNAIAVIVTGSGHRTADSFEGGASKAPLLHVEYQ
jgi:SdiA-regulated